MIGSSESCHEPTYAVQQKNPIRSLRRPVPGALGLRAKKIGRLPNSNFGCQCLRWVIRVNFGRESACLPISDMRSEASGWAMKRREHVQRNCQCASTSRQKTHQAKADRAPRFRQCLIIAPRSSTCRVELHWRFGPGANHGRMARIAEAWDRSTAPGATSRSTISSASIRLQRLRLACRSGAQLIPILATRYGWARPGHACLWTDILNPL